MKALKIIGLFAGAVILLFLANATIPVIREQSKLKKQGLSREEMELIRFLATEEDYVCVALGRPVPKDRQWSGFTEVYDEDDTTVVGYYIESKAPGFAARRYYFDTGKNRVTEKNSPFFEEGVEELRKLYHEQK